MKKKILSMALSLIMLTAVSMTGCSPSTPDKQDPPVQNDASTATDAPAQADAPVQTDAEKPYIAVISKGFQHQFWQTVYNGATDAAAEYNVDITFDGPPSESDINVQVDMINNALSKNPAALCLAVLDTDSAISELNEALSKNIPVIGFDSGVPEAPANSVKATASTDNEAAGALAAQSMYALPEFLAKLEAATPDNPVTIAVQSQDATSASIIGRTVGFVDEMRSLAEQLFPNAVEVTGHSNYKVVSTDKAVVTINVGVPPSTNTTDAQVTAQGLLNSKNLIAFYASNEASANGILAATSDGTDLDRENGILKDLIVIGFDAGKAQKSAVKNGWFAGSVTQDPYMIGYLAVELAYMSINGESVSDVDTGCKFYNSANMDDADMAQLLYD